MRVTRSIHTPIRPTLSWHETWEGPDRGLIKCWEVGRRLAADNPALADLCKAGELPVSGWKGGVSRTLKKLTRFGSLSTWPNGKACAAKTSISTVRRKRPLSPPALE